MELKDAVAQIPDGASIGLGRPGALNLVRELIRQGHRGLHVVTAPTGSLALELLVEAGAVDSVETSGVDLGEWGEAPAFTRAVELGRLRVVDTSCPALLLGLQAAASGLSFTPVPGLLGSDLLRERSDFRVMDDPYRPGCQVVLVPAIQPDFALVHGRRADGEGNVVISTRKDDRLLIQASKRAIATVDEIRPGPPGPLAADEQLIPAAYLDAVVEAPQEPEQEAVRAYLGRLVPHA